MASLLYPVKFVHREHGPEFKDVPIIQQLRAQVTILQKEGDIERPSTREDLEALNRWITWEEVVEAVKSQRSRFEATHGMRPKARESCDLLMLALFVLIPPNRGLEIRTLELVGDDSNMQDSGARKTSQRNLVFMHDDNIRIQFNNYKTKKFRGRDQMELKPEEELFKILREYVRNYRHLLATEASGQFLLLNRVGDPYSCSCFSAHLKAVIYGLTGKKAGIQMLRSSFITFSYGRSDCTDAMKDSLAAALRHSREQAQKTYDRRTANDRKAMAVQSARSFAEDRLDQGSEHAQPSGAGERVKPGDFVGLVEEGSSLSSPKILLGQVQFMASPSEVSLLWYKRLRHDLYKLNLDGAQWKEEVASLVPVKVRAAKNLAGVYKLLTSTREIHKQIMET